MIFQAIEFAAKAHSGQFRKGTRLPYIIHPLGVAKILIEHNCAEHVIVAGILHDTIEDTPVTAFQIKNVFGNEVADLVTFTSEPNKSDYTWENRKVYTIRHLATASPEQLLLSLADKYDNIRAIRQDYEVLGDILWKRFNRPKEKQKWYYESLVDVFSKRITDEKVLPLAGQFRREVNRVFG